MLFLHDLPDWMMALSIVATVVALCYAGYFAFHRVYRSAAHPSSLKVGVLPAVDD